MNPVTWSAYQAVLFDLDGVVTPTAEVHMQAWAAMFDGFLASHDGPGDHAPYAASDYFTYIDGKPRFDGVRAFLASRGITVPEGTPQDPPTADTVFGLGYRKNLAFSELLTSGVVAYPGSVRLIDHLRELGLPLAVVSSSANAPAVIAAAGLTDRFVAVVDGQVATSLGLPGKPAPDTFQYGATLLGATAAGSVVLEDAVSGVRAARAGQFGLVIGVDRGVGADTLLAAGADIVVADLEELVG